MASRAGGKLKPLKAPKKDPKEYDEEDVAFLQRKKQEEAALKAARDKAVKGEFRWFTLSGASLWLTGTSYLQAALLEAVLRSPGRSRSVSLSCIMSVLLALPRYPIICLSKPR
ncbi:translation machinery associated TMA7-domain-containing protein [Fomitopsis betulina]|nr:translation machinery associated TMA7-domain-containing protein [Fomitopsis betulina]